MSASARRTSSRNSSTPSTISIMPPRASSPSIPTGSIVYLNATLASWLDYDLAQVGSGGLNLADIVPRDVVSMMTSFSGEPGSVRTETFDLDLRRRNGQFLPVRLYHRIAFGQDGRMGASRTLVLNRSAGGEVDEGQRAAEVRFARFFNNTPIAIATVNRAGPHRSRQRAVLASCSARCRAPARPATRGPRSSMPSVNASAHRGRRSRRRPRTRATSRRSNCRPRARMAAPCGSG